MKILTFRCDFCKYEVTHTYKAGETFPRILAFMGKQHEACDECQEHAIKLLQKAIEKERKDNEPIP